MTTKTRVPKEALRQDRRKYMLKCTRNSLWVPPFPVSYGTAVRWVRQSKEITMIRV
jgi:hypothetical protein